MDNVIKMLNHEGAIFRFQGIMQCVQNKIVTPTISSKLVELKKDNAYICGHPISDYVIAALDILGIEKYTGNDNWIITLIAAEIK